VDEQKLELSKNKDILNFREKANIRTILNRVASTSSFTGSAFSSLQTLWQPNIETKLAPSSHGIIIALL